MSGHVLFVYEPYSYTRYEGDQNESQNQFMPANDRKYRGRNRRTRLRLHSSHDRQRLRWADRSRISQHDGRSLG